MMGGTTRHLNARLWVSKDALALNKIDHTETHRFFCEYKTMEILPDWLLVKKEQKLVMKDLLPPPLFPPRELKVA